MRCALCPSEAAPLAVYCTPCREALDKAAGWYASDFENLPLSARYHNLVAFLVHSERTSEWYIVGHDYVEAVTCKCKSRQYRIDEPCKHMQTVNIILERYQARKRQEEAGTSPLTHNRPFNIFR